MKYKFKDILKNNNIAILIKDTICKYKLFNEARKLGIKWEGEEFLGDHGNLGCFDFRSKKYNSIEWFIDNGYLIVDYEMIDFDDDNLDQNSTKEILKKVLKKLEYVGREVENNYPELKEINSKLHECWYDLTMLMENEI